MNFVHSLLQKIKKEITGNISCSPKFLKRVIQMIQTQYPALFTETLIEITLADITEHMSNLNKEKLN